MVVVKREVRDVWNFDDRGGGSQFVFIGPIGNIRHLREFHRNDFFFHGHSGSKRGRLLEDIVILWQIREGHFFAWIGPYTSGHVLVGFIRQILSGKQTSLARVNRFADLLEGVNVGNLKFNRGFWCVVGCQFAFHIVFVLWTTDHGGGQGGRSALYVVKRGHILVFFTRG